jgi:hypothetical protein
MQHFMDHLLIIIILMKNDFLNITKDYQFMFTINFKNLINVYFILVIHHLIMDIVSLILLYLKMLLQVVN